MEAELIYCEVESVLAALVASGTLDSYDTSKEKRIALINLAEDFFLVSELINGSDALKDSQRCSFEHRVMTHAMSVEMQRLETLSLESLNKQKVLSRFVQDLAASR